MEIAKNFKILPKKDEYRSFDAFKDGGFGLTD